MLDCVVLPLFIVCYHFLIISLIILLWGRYVMDSTTTFIWYAFIHTLTWSCVCICSIVISHWYDRCLFSMFCDCCHCWCHHFCAHCPHCVFACHLSFLVCPFVFILHSSSSVHLVWSAILGRSPHRGFSSIPISDSSINTLQKIVGHTLSLVPCLRSTSCSTTLAIPASTTDIPPLFYYLLLFLLHPARHHIIARQT